MVGACTSLIGSTKLNECFDCDHLALLRQRPRGILPCVATGEIQRSQRVAVQRALRLLQ